MATVPYGCISGPMEILAGMLAHCAGYQAWVQEVDSDIPASGEPRVAYCRQYIHYPLYEREDEAFVYPAAVIEIPSDLDFATIAQSAEGGFFSTGFGMLYLSIWRQVPVAFKNDLPGAWLNYAGTDTDGVKTGLGQIMFEMMDLPAAVEKFEEFDIALIDGPTFFKPGKKVSAKNCIAATLRFSWGMRG